MARKKEVKEDSLEVGQVYQYGHNDPKLVYEVVLALKPLRSSAKNRPDITIDLLRRRPDKFKKL